MLSVTIIGATFLSAQFTIDLAVWLSYDSSGSMQTAFNQLQQNPITRVPFYTLGPALFFIGIIAYSLAIMRYQRGQIVPAILTIIAVIIVVTAPLANAPAILSLIGYLILSMSFAALTKSGK